MDRVTPVRFNTTSSERQLTRAFKQPRSSQGQVRQGAGVTRDGKGEMLEGIAVMLRGGNSREIASAVKDKVQLIAHDRSIPSNAPSWKVLRS